MTPTPARPRVAVLLSTFNGGAHLDAQLDSLKAQEGVAVNLFVRDDGSSDDTLAILARHAGVWPRLATPGAGSSLGPAHSFLELLARAPDDVDLFAFCDQDDVWAPDKLASAADAIRLRGPDEPLLYCARVRYVDETLRPLGESPVDSDGRFEHLLFENIAFGNTVVMNVAARTLISSAPPATGVIMHDWWCALVVSAFGTVLYDPTPRILYRQHRTNVIGGEASRLGEIRRHLEVLGRDPSRLYPIHAQAEELVRLYGERLPPARLALARSLVASRRSLGARLGFAMSGPIVRRRPLDALAARALVAAGFY